jgi:hypothetical protein
LRPQMCGDDLDHLVEPKRTHPEREGEGSVRVVLGVSLMKLLQMLSKRVTRTLCTYVT